MRTSDSERRPNRIPRITIWLLLLILLIAALLRAWGISFGLPFLYHPDEPTYVSIAQRMFKTGDFNPRFFNYPSLFFYLNALAYVPFYLVGKLAGVFSSPSDVPNPLMVAMGVGRTVMPSTFLLGRCLTAAFGVASVLVTFLVGRRMTNDDRVGLIAALALAVSPTSVRNSQLITPDTFAAFWVLLSVWGSLGILHRGKVSDYVIAGITGGLALSTKYNAALVVLPIVLAHFLRRGRAGFFDAKMYVALALTGLAFLLATPYALLDRSKFLEDLRFEAHHYSTGHEGMEGDTLRWYLSYLWRVEGLMVLISSLEVLRGIALRSKTTILVSLFSLAYFAFIARFVVRNDRTILPIVPFLLLLSASWLAGLYERLRNRFREPPRFMPVAGVAFLLVALMVPLRQTIENALTLSSVDSRRTASSWIAGNLPEGSRIAIEPYAPFVNPDVFCVTAVGQMIQHPATWYVTNGIEYLVFGEWMYGRFYSDPDRYSQQISRYEELFDTFGLVRTFEDGGYEVRIYQVQSVGISGEE